MVRLPKPRYGSSVHRSKPCGQVCPGMPTNTATFGHVVAKGGLSLCTAHSACDLRPCLEEIGLDLQRA
eukprot:5210042-Alexandrium_andersonii.AAC.1